MAAEGTLNASAAIQRPMLRCHSLGLWVPGDQLQTKLFKFRGLTLNRPIWPQQAIPRHIIIQNLRFEQRYIRNRGTIPLMGWLVREQIYPIAIVRENSLQTSSQKRQNVFPKMILTSVSNHVILVVAKYTMKQHHRDPINLSEMHEGIV